MLSSLYNAALNLVGLGPTAPEANPEANKLSVSLPHEPFGLVNPKDYSVQLEVVSPTAREAKPASPIQDAILVESQHVQDLSPRASRIVITPPPLEPSSPICRDADENIFFQESPFSSALLILSAEQRDKVAQKINVEINQKLEQLAIQDRLTNQISILRSLRAKTVGLPKEKVLNKPLSAAERKFRRARPAPVITQETEVMAERYERIQEPKPKSSIQHPRRLFSKTAHTYINPSVPRPVSIQQPSSQNRRRG